MQPSGRPVVVAAFAITLALAACGTSLEFPRPPGTREWIIEVTNRSNRPVVVAVAEDTVPMGELVGSAEPGVIPPGETIEVVFVVPPGDGWAIFVNPRPDAGPLLLPRDVPPGRTGRLPIKFEVGVDGSPGALVPNEPGWFT